MIVLCFYSKLNYLKIGVLYHKLQFHILIVVGKEEYRIGNVCIK